MLTILDEKSGLLSDVPQLFQCVYDGYESVVFEVKLAIATITSIPAPVSGIPDRFTELFGLEKVYQYGFKGLLLPRFTGDLYQWGDFNEQAVDYSL